MHDLAQLFKLHGGQTDVLSLWELLFAMSLSLACSLCVGHVYRWTHRSVSYSQSFVQTFIMTALVTTLIMIIIGSNIARAFSLVGALSIIRFRNAVKETRDVGYIFFAMAIAMACGTRFYEIAVLATGFISLTMLAMHMFNYGDSRVSPERILRIQLPPDMSMDGPLQVEMQALFDSFSLIRLENVRQGLYKEAIFSVRCRASVGPEVVIERLSRINQNLKVSYHNDGHTDEI